MKVGIILCVCYYGESAVFAIVEFWSFGEYARWALLARCYSGSRDQLDIDQNRE